jgi:hypothetical protein
MRNLEGPLIAQVLAVRLVNERTPPVHRSNPRTIIDRRRLDGVTPERCTN